MKDLTTIVFIISALSGLIVAITRLLQELRRWRSKVNTDKKNE